MSWMRMGHALKWFKGRSKSYVYSDGTSVHDYGDNYEDNASFIELLGNIVKRETNDEDYALKIVITLAKKLGIEDQLEIKSDTETYEKESLNAERWAEEDKIKREEESVRTQKILSIVPDGCSIETLCDEAENHFRCKGVSCEHHPRSCENCKKYEYWEHTISNAAGWYCGKCDVDCEDDDTHPNWEPKVKE